MSKKRKRISRRRLAGQRVMAHVPIYHIETGKHKPVTAARRFIAENGLSAPSVFNVRRNEHTTDRFFWGEKGLFSAQYAEENHFLFPSLVSTLFILNPMNSTHISAKTTGKKTIASFIIFLKV